MGGVQRHILSMTEQLHSSEIERKQLRATELKLREHVVKQRHALEMSDDRVRMRIGGEQEEGQRHNNSELTELKGDYDTLRTDYSELTKIMHQCEAELKLGLNSGVQTPNPANVSGDNFHTTRSRPLSGRPDDSHKKELQTWLIAQKGALGRIDALQSQITAYRQKLVESQVQQARNDKLEAGDILTADEFDTKLDLSELK